jgi:putative DNA primase/helicase
MIINATTPIELEENSLQTAQKSDRRLTSRHYADLIEKRGLALDWVAKNCYSAPIEQATEALAYRAQSPGILLQGDGWQMQFKPDKPWKGDGDKKAPKYRSPLGDYDTMLPSHPNDKTYWTDLEALKQRCIQIDGHPYIVVTEGFFKAIAGCSNNIPTIALLGVEMGLTSAKADPQGKRYLVQSLEKYARAGFGFIIALDADCATNPFVIEAERKLTHQLKKFNIPVLSITGTWTVDEGKGMDDFIQKNGIEEFRQLLLTAEERQWQQEHSQGKRKPPSADKLARKIADKYRDKLAWNIEVREWYSYGLNQPGIWEKEPKEAVEQVVRVELDAELPDGYSYRNLSDIINLLKSDLLVKKWNQVKGYIPLQNGVLNKKTKKLSPHSPVHRLTHCLPFAYDPEATCQPIVDWLKETVGHKDDLVQFLLAYLNAVVNQRSDLQRYLELIGPGGTGKSTYMKLASALVGERNVHTTKHQILEESRFETANLAGKLLVLITEADQYVGAVNVLKAITGQDPLHYEQKMKQAGEGFIYEGMCITAGNEPSRSSDYTSGLARRKIPVWFRNFISSQKRRDLDSEFKQYLPGLLNLVLSFSDQEVTDLIRNAEHKCPSLQEYQRETLCETNPIADWLDNKVIRSPGTRHTPSYYYEAFKKYLDESGQKGVSLKRFSNLLIDVCQVQLGWADVSKGRNKYGRYIEGLELRHDGDFSPFPITEGDRLVTDGDGLGDGLVTAETTAVYGCDGCDAFLDDVSPGEDFFPEDVEKNSLVNDLENGTQSDIPVTNPSPNPSPTPPQIPETTDDELQGWEAYSQKTPYPNPKSDNVRSSQKRALAIRQAYCAANTKEDLSALQRENGGKFSRDELTWVLNWLKKFFLAEYNHVKATAKISQPELL